MNPDTPLVIATCKGLSGCVDYLLEVGADANIRSEDVSFSFANWFCYFLLYA
jgi:hypothetical protein